MGGGDETTRRGSFEAVGRGSMRLFIMGGVGWSVGVVGCMVNVAVLVFVLCGPPTPSAG